MTDGAGMWRESGLPVAGHGPLCLRQCGPAQPAQAQVVIAPAVGVGQRFYQALGEWLVGQGYAVTTFDYRGHGASLHGPLRRVQADLLNWAADCAAVAAHVRAQAADVPLFWLGHSVGAQLPGMCSPPLPIDGLLAVASGSGYWRDNAPPTRRKVRLWWWGIAPVLTALCGCLPGRRWGLVGDLPAGVLWQWRRWCLHPDYAVGVEPGLRAAYAAATYPVLALSMADDEMMSARSTASLVGWYTGTDSAVERLQPEDAGGLRIGHFGFFRPEMAATLWPRALAVLQRWQAATPQAGAGASESAPASGSGYSAAMVHSTPRYGGACPISEVVP